MNLLNIEHIHKVFGEKVIFDDVSFGVHEGDKIGIIGINGTGKSTLLKIIAGVQEADGGQIVKQNGLRIKDKFSPRTSVSGSLIWLRIRIFRRMRRFRPMRWIRQGHRTGSFRAI